MSETSVVRETSDTNGAGLKGRMTANWPTYPFDEVIDFQEGPGILARDFRPKGVPLIRLSGLEKGNAVLTGCNFLDPDMVNKRWSHFTLSQGDVLLSTSASLGRIAVVDEEASGAIPYTGIIRMRPRDERLDASFIKYLLESPNFQQQVESFGVGSVIRHFGPMHLRQMFVQVPPLSEQYAIAHILGTLDDKIELNRHMNRTLEEIARALFHSWFVAFDPVRAKAEGRQPSGMDAATAALFPDTFEQTEQGEIPAGWHMGKVGDLVHVSKKTLNPARYPAEMFEHYSLPAFDAGRNPTVEPGSAIKSNKTIVESGAVLISKLNPHIPRVWFPELSKERRSICSTEFLVALPHAAHAQPFVYALFTSESFTHMFASLVTGTTGSHQRVSPTGLLSLPITIPPQQVIERYCEVVIPLLQFRARNRAANNSLAALRDMVLPKLLSGEIRVGELDAMAAQVAG